ncbi:MAG TPA: phytanoyl-CoA dioxygenase, partial [Gammaproteobacteria bacterium]|nr:phytanoyl-CoA dioxygenase [Gammaproteobacteria bacterium]
YVCAPGDVVIHNRQLVHGAFANTSKDSRVSFTFGTHRRSSILDVEAGLHNTTAVYDAARILERSRMIGYAIDARRQYFPEETPYCYKPLLDVDDARVWSPEAKALLRNYNLLDLSI